MVNFRKEKKKNQHILVKFFFLNKNEILFFNPLSVFRFIKFSTSTYIMSDLPNLPFLHIYIYIYIYVCVCMYGHLPPITKTIQVRRPRHAGHCWRSRDELISDVLLWTPTHGRAKAGRPARTYIQQLCEDTGCCPEDLPEAMNDREKWRERVRDIRATSMT